VLIAVLQSAWDSGGTVFHAFVVVGNAVEDETKLFGRDERRHYSDTGAVESAISSADL
jgi:hypothetical protein